MYETTMAGRIDVEALISEAERRLPLWNPKLKEYKDINLKQTLWMEIRVALNESNGE